MNTRTRFRRSGLARMAAAWLVGVVIVVWILNLGVHAAPETRPAQAVSVITVDSGTDPDNSKSKTCLNATPCTLRRAIVQARGLSAAQRPALIQFDIPDEPNEGYDIVLGVWEIPIMTTSDPSVFRSVEGGQVWIDGETQPGGRSSGPKIILIGPGTGNKDGLILGVNNSGSHDGNILRGVAFQNFKTHVIVNSNHNIIERNWFGLSSDGQGVFLRDDEPEDGSGSAGVALSANVRENDVRNNVFLGFDGVAAAIRGEANLFRGNSVGTVADGSVPQKQTDPQLVCSPVDWLGGGGISLEGEKHVVDANVLAGLRQEIFHGSTQPDAIRATGDEHIIVDNRIGIDLTGTDIGVCGRGIYLIDSPEALQVRENVIVQPRLSAISLNGVLYDANTLRGNLIKTAAQWPQVEGNPAAEDAIQLGPSLPGAFRSFQPARVTAISGKVVSGASGIGSPCPNCVVEVFLDDSDSVKEALASLAITAANAQGEWTVTLPAPLTSGQGLRTTSTTQAFNTISGMSSGTTTGLSELYIPRMKVYLPLVQ